MRRSSTAWTGRVQLRHPRRGRGQRRQPDDRWHGGRHPRGRVVEPVNSYRWTDEGLATLQCSHYRNASRTTLPSQPGNCRRQLCSTAARPRLLFGSIRPPYPVPLIESYLTWQLMQSSPRRRPSAGSPARPRTCASRPCPLPRRQLRRARHPAARARRRRRHSNRGGDGHASRAHAGIVLEPDERAAHRHLREVLQGPAQGRGHVAGRAAQVRTATNCSAPSTSSPSRATRCMWWTSRAARGVKVEVIDNSQLLTYAMMVWGWSRWRLTARMPKIDRCSCTSCSRCSPATRRSAAPATPRSRSGTGARKVLLAMGRAKQPDAPFNPGAHCSSARSSRSARRCWARAAAAGAGRAGRADGREAVRLARQGRDDRDMDRGAARTRARAATAGTPIPGWKLVDKRATRKWSDEDAVLDTGEAPQAPPCRSCSCCRRRRLEKKFREHPDGAATVRHAAVERQESGARPGLQPSRPIARPAARARRTAQPAIPCLNLTLTLKESSHE